MSKAKEYLPHPPLKKNRRMKREIKFRAWLDGKHGNITFNTPLMDYDVTIQDGKYAIVESGWDIHGTYDTVPLMQYTGLKDKNGVEIYEGDIVETPSGQKATIKYSEDNYQGFICDEISCDWFWNLKALTIEVVGNIHENPELLN